MSTNEGTLDRIIRAVVAVAALVGALVVGFGSVWAWVLLVIAVIAGVTAAVGFCPLYPHLRPANLPGARGPFGDSAPAGAERPLTTPESTDVERGDVAAALPAELPGLLRYATSIVGDADVAEDLVRGHRRAGAGAGWDVPRRLLLATWLHRILHNLAVDRMRRRREVPAGDLTAETSETVQVAAVEQRWHDDAYTVDAATVVARAEQAQELRDALIRLPYDHRAAVVLHDAEGLTARQIAEVFDIGLPAAKQQVRRGRMMLVSSLAAGMSVARCSAACR